MGKAELEPVGRLLRYAAAVTVSTAVAGAGLLAAQVRQARRDIPRAEAPPPRASGWYGGPRGRPPLVLAMLGDSSAAGYGVHKPRQTPGALLATGISRRLGRPVRLHCLAVVGATSSRLAPQVEAALEVSPDLAVIVVGGNDITHRANRAAAVRHLARAVRQLREAGAQVVVGTCPDLGTIRPIRPPLRWIAGHWSRKLAAAQTVAAVEAGAWTVSLGDLLGPRFAAEPARMFSFDRFHPSADGYAAAAAVMLPTALAALGTVDPRVLPAQKVRSLPRAAAEASRHAGTEVSASSVAGDRRGPGGRWALLRRPTGSMLWRRVVDMVRQRGPDDMVRQHGPDDMVRQRGPDDMVRQRGPDDRETTTATGRTGPTGRTETDDGAGTAEQLERR